ncbi:hypothetical protein Lal_00015277 [Lupinus albus]|nr:hypothetical protein Lal_00015277 [Lupinus albus]
MAVGQVCPHRLVVQDISLSRRQRGFDFPWGVVEMLNSWKPRLIERFSPERERITWEGEIIGLELEEKKEKGAFQEQGALGLILELEKRVNMSDKEKDVEKESNIHGRKSGRHRNAKSWESRLSEKGVAWARVAHLGNSPEEWGILADSRLSERTSPKREDQCFEIGKFWESRPSEEWVA